MSDIKRYYYLKLKDNFFDSEEIKILENLQNGIYYSNLLIKLYLKSLKFNRALKFNEYIPYDENMIATITNLNIDIVRSGLKVLYSMKLIERLDDGTIYMMNIQSFIGKSNSEADRKRIYRQRIEEEKMLLGKGREPDLEQSSIEFPKHYGTIDGTFLDNRPPEIEIDKEIELERETDIDNIDKNKDSYNEKLEDIQSQSVSLFNYFEKITGLVGVLNLGAIKIAVKDHGADNVKRAMDRALARNKPTMIYINGILKNWAKEGYPRGGEERGNGSIRKNNEAGTNEFRGFKPKEPKSIDEWERIDLEEELL